jgi:hypothetical protein
MLITAGVNHARSFVRNHPAGVIGLAFFCMTLLTNMSESVFARRGTLWSAFLLTTIGYAFLARARDATEESALIEEPYEFAAEGKTTDLAPF